MNKVAFFITLFNAILAWGQNTNQTYKFKNDIYDKYSKDTTYWKYQMQATDLSFSGYYSDVLKTNEEEWVKMGIEKTYYTKADSIFFNDCKKVNAKEYILNKSKEAEIIIINEAHHIPKHRTFTCSLLQGLYNNGYRYLGLEALFDTSINEQKFPVIESGFYTKEPEFGIFITEAIKTGFILFGYEAAKDKNGKDREIEQAENIQKFIEKHPNGKVLIHCGYAHAYENEYPAWEKAMAGRLKENLHVNPFTINQTLFVEKPEKENSPLFMQMNKTGTPIVLINDSNQVYNGTGENKQTDIVIIHPKTNYINGRPDWLICGKQKYTLHSAKTIRALPALAFAYRKGEFEKNGIPADIIEIPGNNAPQDFYLKQGIYTIITKGPSYKIIDKYDVEIK